MTFDNDLGVQAMTMAQKLFQADIAIDEEPFEENYFAEIAAGNVAMTPQAVWYRGFGIEPNARTKRAVSVSGVFPCCRRREKARC